MNKILSLIFASIGSAMFTTGLVVCMGAMLYNLPDNFILGVVMCITAVVAMCAGVFVDLVEHNLV